MIKNVSLLSDPVDRLECNCYIVIHCTKLKLTFSHQILHKTAHNDNRESMFVCVSFSSILVKSFP